MNTLAWAALGVAVGVSAAAWLLVDGDHPAAPPRVPTAAASRTPQVPPPRGSPTVAPAAAASAPLAPAPEVGIIELSGVAGGPGRQALALVSANHGPQRMLRVGDPIGGHSKVLRIDAESMTYGSPGRELRLFVSPAPADAALPVGRAVAVMPVPSGPRLVADVPALAPAGAAEPGSGNQTFRQAFERKRLAIQASR